MFPMAYIIPLGTLPMHEAIRRLIRLQGKYEVISQGKIHRPEGVTVITAEPVDWSDRLELGLVPFEDL